MSNMVRPDEGEDFDESAPESKGIFQILIDLQGYNHIEALRTVKEWYRANVKRIHPDTTGVTTSTTSESMAVLSQKKKKLLELLNKASSPDQEGVIDEDSIYLMYAYAYSLAIQEPNNVNDNINMREFESMRYTPYEYGLIRSAKERIIELRSSLILLFIDIRLREVDFGSLQETLKEYISDLGMFDYHVLSLTDKLTLLELTGLDVDKFAKRVMSYVASYFNSIIPDGISFIAYLESLKLKD